MKKILFIVFLIAGSHTWAQDTLLFSRTAKRKQINTYIPAHRVVGIALADNEYMEGNVISVNDTSIIFHSKIYIGRQSIDSNRVVPYSVISNVYVCRSHKHHDCYQRNRKINRIFYGTEVGIVVASSIVGFFYTPAVFVGSITFAAIGVTYLFVNLKTYSTYNGWKFSCSSCR